MLTGNGEWDYTRNWKRSIRMDVIEAIQEHSKKSEREKKVSSNNNTATHSTQ